MFTFLLCFNLQSCLFQSGFQTKIVYALLVSLTCVPHCTPCPSDPASCNQCITFCELFLLKPTNVQICIYLYITIVSLYITLYKGKILWYIYIYICALGGCNKDNIKMHDIGIKILWIFRPEMYEVAKIPGWKPLTDFKFVNGRLRGPRWVHGGRRWAQWLGCCAANRKVAGSISDGVIGIFHWHNPSDRTMILVSTQPPTEMSTRSICWG